MKRIIILLLGSALLVLASHVLNSGAAAETPVVGDSEVIVSEISAPEVRPSNQVIEFANKSEAIIGTWYSYPVGVIVRFNDDGSADFGLDANGNAVGYRARTWFEGKRLFIAFNDYDGQSQSCASAVGSYEVGLLENGGIVFDPHSDDCHFRLDILSGSPELGSQLAFHPVE